MKKIALLSALIIFVVASCKKDSGSPATVSPASAPSVSDALTIWHGTNVKGVVTGNNNGVLVVDSTPLQIQSYKGGYAVITPSVLSGTIAGYYIHVNGANSYFNVNFSNALGRPIVSNTAARPILRGVHTPRQHKKSGFLFRPATDSSSYADSVVVIQLPSNIDTGTFCMEYWAYDDNNDISDSVSVCVTIDQLGSSNGSSFAGNWELTGLKEGSQSDDVGTSGATRDTSWYSNLEDSNNIQDYMTYMYCVDGYISYDSGFYVGNDMYGNADSMIQGSTFSLSIPEYFWYTTPPVLTLSSNGAWATPTSIETSKEYADVPLALCSNIPYIDVEDTSLTSTGGWSYNASTNIFTVVEVDSGASAENTFVSQFTVTQKTATGFILNGIGLDNGDDLAFIKQ